VLEGQFRLIQPRQIVRVLQVEMGGRPSPPSDELASKRRFADLPGTQYCDYRMTGQKAFYALYMSVARYHFRHFTLKIERHLLDFQ
jgi:hypothetical protein